MTCTSNSKTSYYRRMYVAYLIDSGTNTVSALLEITEMHKRTLQDTLNALSELDIVVESRAGTKSASYKIEFGGALDKEWIKKQRAV